MDKAQELLEALNSLLNPDLEKYSQSTGCPMCDNGKLRNPGKEHWDNCNWNNARKIYEKYSSPPPVRQEPNKGQVSASDWLKENGDKIIQTSAPSVALGGYLYMAEIIIAMELYAKEYAQLSQQMKEEMESCECGHTVPLKYSIHDEDGNATCMPCAIEELSQQPEVRIASGCHDCNGTGAIPGLPDGEPMLCRKCNSTGIILSSEIRMPSKGEVEQKCVDEFPLYPIRVIPISWHEFRTQQRAAFLKCYDFFRDYLQKQKGV